MRSIFKALAYNTVFIIVSIAFAGCVSSKDRIVIEHHQVPYDHIGIHTSRDSHILNYAGFYLDHVEYSDKTQSTCTMKSIGYKDCSSKVCVYVEYSSTTSSVERVSIDDIYIRSR